MKPPVVPAAPTAAPADVLLDVEVERGALHFVLANLGPGAAHAVRVRFSRSLRDLAGLRVNDNPLFTRLEFLAPGRRVRLLVDTLPGYAARGQPPCFEARLSWQDDDGRPQRRSLRHDLGAWGLLRESLDAPCPVRSTGSP